MASNPPLSAGARAADAAASGTQRPAPRAVWRGMHWLGGLFIAGIVALAAIDIWRSYANTTAETARELDALSRVIAEAGLQDRLASLMLVYPGFTIPFATWLLMGFFKTIPPELEDAALVDGSSRLGALVRVVFPISLPGILTVVIFSFSLCVNEFIYAE